MKSLIVALFVLISGAAQSNAATYKCQVFSLELPNTQIPLFVKIVEQGGPRGLDVTYLKTSNGVSTYYSTYEYIPTRYGHILAGNLKKGNGTSTGQISLIIRERMHRTPLTWVEGAIHFTNGKSFNLTCEEFKL